MNTTPNYQLINPSMDDDVIETIQKIGTSMQVIDSNLKGLNDNSVPKSRTLNNKPLSDNITLNAADIKANDGTSLEDFKGSTASQLNEMAYHISMFGAKGDGVTDDTIAIQNTINLAQSTGGSVVFDKNKPYKITLPVIITNNNVHIDGNGATIKYYNQSIAVQDLTLRSSWVGMIYFQGKIDSLVTPVNILGYATQVGKFLNNSFDKRGKWTVGSVTGFNIGDMVLINIPYRTQTRQQYIPQVQTAAVIVDIDTINKVIYTDYYNPFNWDNYVWGSDNTISRLIPVENCSIDNMNFLNLNPETNIVDPPTVQVTGANRQYAVSAIGAFYCKNIKVNNCHGKSLYFSLFEPYGCHTVDINNISSINPCCIGPGEGYGIHSQMSSFVTIKKAKGINGRHTVDFSGGGFNNVYDATGNSYRSFDFDLHGIGEHDISFNNCVGSITMGNGIDSFACIMANVSFNKHNGYLAGCEYVNNLTCKDSTLIVNYLSTPKVTFDNCKLTFKSGGVFTPNKRGRTDKTIFTIDKCDIDIVSFTNLSSENVGFNDAGTLGKTDIKLDILKIVNSYLDFSLLKGKFLLQNIDTINIDKNTIKNTVFSIDTATNNNDADSSYVDYLARHNVFIYDDNCQAFAASGTAYMVFRTTGIKNVANGVINIKDNDIKCLTANAITLICMQRDTIIPNMTGSKLKYTFIDNTIYAGGTGAITLATYLKDDIKFTLKGLNLIGDSSKFIKASQSYLDAGNIDIIDNIPQQATARITTFPCYFKKGAVIANINSTITDVSSWIITTAGWIASTTWTSGINVSENTTYIYNGNVYLCLVAKTNSTATPDLDTATFKLLGTPAVLDNNTFIKGRALVNYGNGTPLNVITPLTAGEMYYDRTAQIVWIASSVQSSSWVKVAATFS